MILSLITAQGETPMPGTCLSAWTSCRDGKCRWSNDIVIVIDQATEIIVEVCDEERRIADRPRR